MQLNIAKNSMYCIVEDGRDGYIELKGGRTFVFQNKERKGNTKLYTMNTKLPIVQSSNLINYFYPSNCQIRSLVLNSFLLLKISIIIIIIIIRIRIIIHSVISVRVSHVARPSGQGSPIIFLNTEICSSAGF